MVLELVLNVYLKTNKVPEVMAKLSLNAKNSQQIPDSLIQKAKLGMSKLN